jgi:rhodanese-related sulfurtransferase
MFNFNLFKIMFKIFKKLFSTGPDISFGELLQEGALIVDVRTKGEFASGHVPGAINIPLDTLSGQLGKLKGKDQPIITCCASGMRSASAKSILEAKGFSRVYNGGSWVSLKSKLQHA